MYGKSLKPCKRRKKSKLLYFNQITRDLEKKIIWTLLDTGRIEPLQ